MKITPRNFKKINLAFCVAAALSAFMANPAYSAEKVEKAIDLPVVIKPTPKNTAPQPYRPVAGVTPELAQVVVYYSQGTAPAAVYVDRELQSVLLPGQFTVMCAAPGAHTVESLFNDHTNYTRQPHIQAPLSSG